MSRNTIEDRSPVTRRQEREADRQTYEQRNRETEKQIQSNRGAVTVGRVQIEITWKADERMRFSVRCLDEIDEYLP